MRYVSVRACVLAVRASVRACVRWGVRGGVVACAGARTRPHARPYARTRVPPNDLFLSHLGAFRRLAARLYIS